VSSEPDSSSPRWNFSRDKRRRITDRRSAVGSPLRDYPGAIVESVGLGHRQPSPDGGEKASASPPPSLSRRLLDPLEDHPAGREAAFRNEVGHFLLVRSLTIQPFDQFRRAVVRGGRRRVEVTPNAAGMTDRPPPNSVGTWRPVASNHRRLTFDALGLRIRERTSGRFTKLCPSCPSTILGRA
jgi:hypothetical protein